MKDVSILLVGFPEFEMGFSQGSRVLDSVDVPLEEGENLKHVRIFPRPSKGKPVRGFDSDPTFYDYNIIILHPSALDSEVVESSLMRKSGEIETFLDHMNGFIVVPVPESRENLSWLPEDAVPDLVEKSGERINFDYDHWLAGFIERSKRNVDYLWKSHLPETLNELPPGMRNRVVGVNLLGSPVSWERRFGNGRIVFLPHYSFIGDKSREGKTNAEVFVRKLLDAVKRRMKSPQKEPVPSWFGRRIYKIKEEIDISKQIRELEKKRAVLSKSRDVLWKRDHGLVLAVKHILEEVGFSPEIRKEYVGDLDISERGLKAVMRVIDTRGTVDVADVRHLLDWYAGAVENDTSVKGILVVNHFWESEPADRKKECIKALKEEHPFRKEVVLLARNNGFCLMTTSQIYQMFKIYSDGSMTKTEFINTLKDTNGVLKTFQFKKLKA